MADAEDHGTNPEFDEENHEGDYDIDQTPSLDPPAFVRRVKLSLQGMQYDINHWSQLPPVQENQSTLQCVKYVATRGQRGPYLFSFFIFLLLLVCISLAVRGGRRSV